VRLSASVGFAARTVSASAESLCRDAGVALHRAKRAGGGRVEEFREHMREEALARLELEADLRHAIGREELALVLQPIVRLEDRTEVRAEALARWRRNGRDVPPTRFIGIAEDSGLIVPLGDWIIGRAAHIADRTGAPCVTVNLSARQLASPRLGRRIAHALTTYRLAPDRLGFEITESVLVDGFDHALSVLHGIRDLGCTVGLDDFGTGYSSLSYLRRLPLDFIKLDRTLTADVDEDRHARAVIGAVITMADALGLDVVAEGVETDEQADQLRRLGCAFGQGFLFGAPAPR
jgi:EAL domain-containing protein (putative c-di-GMP-specific phosphodiesterase class I)